MKILVKNNGKRPEGVRTTDGLLKWVKPGHQGTFTVAEVTHKALTRIKELSITVKDGEPAASPEPSPNPDPAPISAGEGEALPIDPNTATKNTPPVLDTEPTPTPAPVAEGEMGADTENEPNPDADLIAALGDDELVQAIEDQELRDFIERRSGEKPHHALGRVKLLEQARALAAPAPVAEG